MSNVCFSFVCVNLLVCQFAYSQDSREYQHGIDFVPLPDGQYKLIWSSSGHPPSGADQQGNWTHDVYSSPIDPTNPQIVPTTLISRAEAQEPASSAITSDGNIMVTMEDGWNVANTIGQRFGVYDSNLSPVDAYPNMVFDGGHSGHVAAVDNRFVVFYSDEWVYGGGVDNLGTGDDVLLKVYNSTGTFERSKAVAVGGATRDWWPLVAGSENHAMLLWQRYVDNEVYSDLMFSIYNPASGDFVQTESQLATNLQYYTYDVQYLSGVERFLVLGTHDNGEGFAFLVDDAGNITAENSTLPGIVREAQPAVRLENGITRVVYPIESGGVMVLSVTDLEINLHSTVGGASWDTAGSDGIFTDNSSTFFVNLSPAGIREYKFALGPLVSGDFDGNGIVDAGDYTAWKDDFGMSVTPGTGADGNRNGIIDAADYTVWLDNLGSVITGSAVVAVVPEPSTLGLFTALLLSLLCLQWRRQESRPTNKN